MTGVGEHVGPGRAAAAAAADRGGVQGADQPVGLQVVQVPATAALVRPSRSARSLAVTGPSSDTARATRSRVESSPAGRPAGGEATSSGGEIHNTSVT